MNIVAIGGSYRRGRTIDALVEETVRGVRAIAPDARIEVIRLIDRHIEYCRGCLTCHNDDPAKPVASCPIPDDMPDICRTLDAADGYIFASPMYEGAVTAIMKCFLERMCWVLSRPGHRPLEGCPEPRNPRRKAAVCIVSTGLLSPLVTRLFCRIKQAYRDTLPCILNAPIVGMLYACKSGIEKPRAQERHLSSAFKLGQKLARHVQQLQKKERP